MGQTDGLRRRMQFQSMLTILSFSITSLSLHHSVSIIFLWIISMIQWQNTFVERILLFQLTRGSRDRKSPILILHLYSSFRHFSFSPQFINKSTLTFQLALSGPSVWPRGKRMVVGGGGEGSDEGVREWKNRGKYGNKVKERTAKKDTNAVYVEQPRPPGITPSQVFKNIFSINNWMKTLA